MTKRITKAEGQLIVLAFVVGLPMYGLYMLGVTIGWIWFAVIIVVFVGAYFWYRAERNKARRAKLLSKYGDDKIVEKIMNRYFWQGQTAGQLRDSLGNPIEYDRKVLKAGKREVWK